MENNPLVTVNILSYNRKDELRNTLSKVYEQDYKNIEVIVVDNASSDGSPEMVEKEFPSVILIKLNKNIGIAGWNKGFEIAKGEYVLVLDDDSYPTFNAILSGVAYLNVNYQCAIIAYDVYDYQTREFQTLTYKDEKFNEFIGCGALISSAAIKKIGFFDPNIFIYAHERDYSLRTYNEGYFVKYFKDHLIHHRKNFNSSNHPILSSKRYFNQTVSYIYICFKYLSRFDAFRVTIKLLFNRFLVAIYFKFYKDFIYILLFLIERKKFLKRQIILSNDCMLTYLNNLNVPIFDNLYFCKIRRKYPKVLWGVVYLRTLIKSNEEKSRIVSF
jgi:GT2 family glycosyltransferase